MSMLYFIKGLVSVINLVIMLLIIAFVLKRYKKLRAARILLGMTVVIILLSSTYYLPHYLADKIERKYAVFNPSLTINDSGKAFIVVLGSGYTLDNRLPPNSQLGMVALARLAEGIRIHRLIKNSFIICSGYGIGNNESQALVTMRAALAFGVDQNSLGLLEKPRTTSEEAEELRKVYPPSSKVILVTDALHMPRAMKIFRDNGFDPIAAPTNFKVTKDAYASNIKFIPSFSNMGLMDYVLREWMGNIKASILRLKKRSA